MKEENLSSIKEIFSDFFAKMGEEPEINLELVNNHTLKIDLYLQDPRPFIGQGGQVLSAIQHVLNRLAHRKTQEALYLDLDINDYKKNKITYIKEIAVAAAEDVVLTKKEKILPPMPAYERRIVHMELADRQDVTTESIGEGEDRRIVVKSPNNPGF